MNESEKDVKQKGDTSQTPCYWLKCSTCAGMVAVSVDAPDMKKENAKFVADGVREGFDVQRCVVQDVRRAAIPWCECVRAKRAKRKKEPAQPSFLHNAVTDL